MKENEPEADLELCFFKNKLKIQIKIFLIIIAFVFIDPENHNELFVKHVGHMMGFIEFQYRICVIVSKIA